MKTIEEIIEYLEKQLRVTNDFTLYWHEVYKNTQDKNIKKQAKKLSDEYFDKFIILREIMRFVNNEIY